MWPVALTAATPLRPQAPAVAPPVIFQGASGTAVAPGGVPIASNTLDIGEQWDYVFRPELFATPRFGGGSGAVPGGVLQRSSMP